MRAGVLIFLVVFPIGALFFWPPFPQPLWYHNFADQRCLLCVPHCLNVVSNLPFVVVGIWGLVWMWRAEGGSPLIAHTDQGADANHLPFLTKAERWPFWVFFAGIALTGVGSAYYHSDPNNERLVWDRLPLAVAFMALFTSVLAERIDVRLTWLLIPLTILGGGSVLYWSWSESQGAGDLRPYLLVQLFPMLALPLLLILFPPRYTRTRELIGALVWYGAAKLLELADALIYNQGQIVSGHTLKHLLAAFSAYLVLHMVQRRRGLNQV